MRGRKSKRIRLFLESSKDFRIMDQDGHTVSLEDARLICESGALQNYNLAFQRLVQNRFDLEAVKSYYAEERERWNVRQARGQA